ncbi:radical SAM protein [Thermodesulfobacteriota bacterium]
MEPSYLELHRRGVLKERVDEALALMKSCRLCPRECGVNRLEDETGFCRTGRRAKIASHNAHFGEESPLVGTRGSGTIFISSCNLLCSFCQNYEISHLNEGVEAGPEEIAAIMIQLAENGCHNINFVTPTHVVPQLIEALIPAIEQGLRIPLVYNSSGYDKKETLELLDGIFDIYMPDLKFWDEKWSDRYCKAPNYREYVTSAIKEMHRQVDDLIIDEKGMAERGLLVRHLVMPDKIAGTFEAMRFLAEEISKDTYVNLMDQYRPCGEAAEDEFINRRLSAEEFHEATKMTRRAGITRFDSRDRVRLIFR